MSLDAGNLPARETKARLRLLARSRIDAMPAALRAEADRSICQRLVALCGDLGAGTAMGYAALSDEVCIDAFLAEASLEGREVFLPRVHAARIAFTRWRPGIRLARDEKGILAPEGTLVDVRDAGGAIIVVPGRAFDESGTRLGRGGGYYDRLLSEVLGGLVVGVAYECQLLANIPREGHDQPVALLVTERRCVRIGEQG